MHEIIVVKRRKIEYTILVEVEFLQEGQQEHKLHAADPQQQAKVAAHDAVPRTAPIFCIL